MGWLKKLVDSGNAPSKVGEIPSYYNMLEWGNKVDDGGDLPDIWHSNVSSNIDFFERNPGRWISAHDVDVRQKAAIIVGASPNLKENYHYLKTVDRSKFSIACTNSAAEFLVDHGIIPDFISLIDGQQFDWTLNVGEIDSKLIVSPFAYPDVLQSWKGDYVVLPYGIKDSRFTEKCKQMFGDTIGQAGNAFNCTVGFYVQCTEANIFLFVGNELSFDGKYYVKNKSRNDESMYFFSDDVDGNRVKTLIPLYQYKIWLENLCFELHMAGYYFFNCSRGILGVGLNGERLDYITPIDLPEAIDQVEFAFEFEKQSDSDKMRQAYDMIYSTGRYIPKNGIYNWLEVHRKIEDGEIEPFKRALDVGCGPGLTVFEMTDRGYDVTGIDIADNSPSWDELGILDRCFVAPAHEIPFGDNVFDFVMVGDVMEHIPESLVDKSLSEIARVGCGRFWFIIANGIDSPSKGLPHTHITIAGIDYWLNKIHESGLKILHAGESKHHCSIVCEKESHADQS